MEDFLKRKEDTRRERFTGRGRRRRRRGQIIHHPSRERRKGSSSSSSSFPPPLSPSSGSVRVRAINGH